MLSAVCAWRWCNKNRPSCVCSLCWVDAHGEERRFDTQPAQLPHGHFYVLTSSLCLTGNDLFIYLVVWLSYVHLNWMLNAAPVVIFDSLCDNLFFIVTVSIWRWCVCHRIRMLTDNLRDVSVIFFFKYIYICRAVAGAVYRLVQAFDEETHPFSSVCTSPAFVESKSVALGKCHCIPGLSMLLYHGVL